MRKKIIACALLAAIALTTPVYAQDAQNCSCYTSMWEDSGAYKAFVDGRHSSSVHRDKVYTQFMSVFWGAMDKCPKAKTVGQLFDSIQSSFLKAAKEKGERLSRFGVSAKLVVDDLSCGADGLCTDKLFSEKQLKVQRISENNGVQTLVAGDAKFGYLDVAVRFSKSKNNWVEITVLDNIKSNLTMQSSVKAIELREPSYIDPKSQGRTLRCIQLGS